MGRKAKRASLLTTTETIDALVIGAGPAGLMAASALAKAGRKVVIVESKPSAGRKFLMAGKSGLNLTKDQGFDAFLAEYREAAPWLRPMLEAFGPQSVQDWAVGLGQPVFTGSSGRVFPQAMKASPLLRAWLAQMDAQMHLKWRWSGVVDGAFRFATPNGEQILKPNCTVLALGGGSWARLGSDGAWVPLLRDMGVVVAPMKPTNMGFDIAWSSYMSRYFGAPVKGCQITAGETSVRAEFVVSARGIEGGGVYAVSRELRDGHDLVLDLFPDLSLKAICEKLSRPRGKASLTTHLRKTLGLTGVRAALLQEFARPLPAGMALAQTVKALPVRIEGPRPIDEAISTAGGVTRTAVNQELMLKDLPGVFVAGEMLDWEAPTGGYLLTACLATGLWAGRHAAEWSRPDTNNLP